MADTSSEVEVAALRVFGLVGNAVVVDDLMAGECWLVTTCGAWRHPLKSSILGMEVNLLVESEVGQIPSWLVLGAELILIRPLVPPTSLFSGFLGI